MVVFFEFLEFIVEKKNFNILSLESGNFFVKLFIIYSSNHIIFKNINQIGSVKFLNKILQLLIPKKHYFCVLRYL